MATTDDLIISLRADVTQLQNSLQQVNQQLNNTQQQGQQANNSLSSGFSQSADKAKMLAAAIGVAVAAMGAMAVRVANNVREFNSLASSLGLSYTQLERLQSISSKANIETDMMIDLAKTLNEQIGEAANGNKDFEESFSRLGLKMDDLIKMSVDEQLLTVAQALGEVTNQSDKAQIGATLFGDNWLPALKLTEQNVKQLADEYEQFGIKLNNTDVTRLTDLDVAFDGLLDNVTQASKKIASDLAPALTVAIKKVNELFQSDLGGIDENISVITFLSIEMGAQMINIFTAINGLVKMTAASLGTLGNMIIMGLGAPIALVMDIYNTNVAFFTNALIKAHNAYKELKGEPFTPIELVEYEKTKDLDTLMAKVRETKAAIADFAKTGAKDFLSGISGDAGSSFRDEAIAEATKIKERLNNVNTDSGKCGGDDGDDGDAAKKAEELRKDAQELLKQTLESNMSELQLQGVHFQNLLSQLKQFNDQKALSDSEYKAGVLAANEAFNNDIIQQVLDASEKEQAALLEKQTAEDEYRTNRNNSIQQVIEESRRAGLTELELLDEQHQQKMDKLAELQKGEVIFKDELKQAELQAELAHSAKKLDIMMGTGSKIQELNKAFQKGQLQGSLAFFAADFGGMSQHSRKLFELTKAARLAEAAINIPSTVMAAAKHGSEIGGWPLGLAMGAAALASQLAQLRAIQSASFGGGSSGAGGGGASASSVAQSQQPQQQPIMQRFVNVSIFGEENTMYSRDSVLKLMQRIGEEVKDGAVFRVV
jgi:hypothetical protein